MSDTANIVYLHRMRLYLLYEVYREATVLNNVFQYASFICGHSLLGSLHNTSPGNKEHGFLSFIGYQNMLF